MSVDVAGKRAAVELLANDIVRDIQDSKLPVGSRSNLVARVRQLRDIAIAIADAASGKR